MSNSMNYEKQKLYYHTTNNCIMCGDMIPEGMQVCPRCESTVEESHYYYVPVFPNTIAPKGTPKNGTHHTSIRKKENGRPFAYFSFVFRYMIRKQKRAHAKISSKHKLA